MHPFKVLSIVSLGGLVLLFFNVFGDYYRPSIGFYHAECLNGHVISVLKGGGLANSIWEYMSLLSFFRFYEKKIKLHVYLPTELEERISDVFESTNVFDNFKVSSACYNMLMPRQRILQINESYIDADFHNNSNTAIALARYSARYEDVLQYGIRNIKRELRFQQKHIEYTNKKFNEIKRLFNFSSEKIIFVGVHYRGTDYIDLLQTIYHKAHNILPDYKYYSKAMRYFQITYEFVIFILVTIDFKWLELNLPLLRQHNNNYLIVVNPNRNDYVKDFVLLSHCNHSIINYGTFGATSALFAEGTTFVYDLSVPLDQRGPTVAMGIAKILPNWYIFQ